LELRQKAREKTLKQLKSYFERMGELDHQEHYSRYFNALTAAFDPHTNYMDPATKEDFNIRMSKSLKGIGAVLQEEDDYTKVMRIVPGSASYRQGDLEAGDIILRVAEGLEGEEIDITGMRIREVVSYIRGEKGTIVRLTVKKSDGKIKIIPIERDIVKLEDAVAKSMSFDGVGDRKYGYVYLPDFYRNHQDPSSRNCTDDVRKEIENLKKENIDALIFDLRGNGGGFLEDARSIAGLFIPSGPIVQVKNSFDKVVVLRDDDRKVTFSKPVVILVDQFSASASEILAAALQDYHRAVVVGSEQTHGKGTVQHLISLDREVPPRWKKGDMGSLKLTIQKFYRIDGGSTQKRGVVPDIILPDDKAYMESGERYLDYALDWDKISPVKYRAWGPSLPLDELRIKSSARVEKSEIFNAAKARGEHLKERFDDTQVVLSRSAMLKDRQQSEEDAEIYKDLMDKLKLKLDPEAYARDKKEKEEKEKAEKEKLVKEMEADAKAKDGEEAVAESEEKKEPRKSPEELKAEEFQRWKEGIRIDPYVRESMAILNDWIEMDGALSKKL
jgi:carboxyl-terminal processing protease